MNNQLAPSIVPTAVIKQTITFHKTFNDGFFRPADNITNSICEGAVRHLGILAETINVHFSSTRPGKKGWHKVTLGNDMFIKLKGKSFPSLYWQREMFRQANQTVGWIKMEPIAA